MYAGCLVSPLCWDKAASLLNLVRVSAGSTPLNLKFEVVDAVHKILCCFYIVVRVRSLIFNGLKDRCLVLCRNRFPCGVLIGRRRHLNGSLSKLCLRSSPALTNPVEGSTWEQSNLKSRPRMVRNRMLRIKTLPCRLPKRREPLRRVAVFGHRDGRPGQQEMQNRWFSGKHQAGGQECR
jgi:hypothetical protein